MTPDEHRITRLYDAFNRRDFEGCVGMMAADVIWPDEAEGGLLKGPQAILDYFTGVAAPLRAHHDLISLHTGSDGRVGVLSRQVITSAADGSEWSSTRVLHRYTLRDGLVVRMDPQQDCQDETFPGVEALLRRLYGAVSNGDLETILTCYTPTAQFADPLEGGEIAGADQIRAHFEHLLATLRLEIGVIDYRIQPDDRIWAQLHVVTRGPTGGLWQDATVGVWYRLEDGLIVEQDIDDAGRNGNEP